MDSTYSQIRNKLALGALDAQRILKNAPYDTGVNEQAYMAEKKVIDQIGTALDKLEHLEVNEGKKCYSISGRSIHNEVHDCLCPHLERLPCMRVKKKR